ncbi:PF14131 domain protein [Capnocytophaga sp. oral taxon 412 str. F0487]|jgi:hypothetical protein|uniref:DUF4298 domain-containing protein n=1 Tax=Capnocytophaga sp. oral taxon 412 TaxID=712218 RepID=UPI0002696EF9|nr:DUF4298 domain-containing protein [Capnocytophaga sp. oral taxon 412]EIW91609.1 PF14131 domain protein [Capnocytophaga sp. oral taxon 412 str. F0487]
MNKRYENISKMNDILAKLENTLTKAQEVLEEWKAIQPEYDQLVTYYDSKQWRQDYFDSNDGKIPDEVPQWVLTQDAIFDAIGTQFYLADEYRTLLDKIKAKEMNP